MARRYIRIGETEWHGAIYWLLRAYQSGHRQGWEPGPSTTETMDGLLHWLSNRGFDPNQDCHCGEPARGTANETVFQVDLTPDPMAATPETVERVARAQHEEYRQIAQDMGVYVDHDSTGWDTLAPGFKQIRLRVAQAAIRALRDGA